MKNCPIALAAARIQGLMITVSPEVQNDNNFDNYLEVFMKNTKCEVDKCAWWNTVDEQCGIHDNIQVI